MTVRSFVMGLENIEQDDALFEQLISDKDIFPDDGERTCVDGEVHCSKHEGLVTQELPEEVSWL